MRVNVTRELLARAILFNAHELPSYKVKQRSEQTSVTCKETKKVSQLNFHCFENKSNNVQNKISDNIFGEQNTRLRAVSLFFFRFSMGSARTPSVTRVVICVSREFCSTDQEIRETARSLTEHERMQIYIKKTNLRNSKN